MPTPDTDLSDRLLTQIHKQRGSPVLRGRGVRAVALHPRTEAALYDEQANWSAGFAPTERAIHGWPIIRTYNVDEGQARIIPNGTLCYPEGPHRCPAIWPNPKVYEWRGTLSVREWPIGLGANECYVADGPARGKRVELEGRKWEVYRSGPCKAVQYEKAAGAPIIFAQKIKTEDMDLPSAYS